MNRIADLRISYATWLRLALGLSAVGGTASPLLGDTNWTGAADQNWSNASNWSNGVPLDAANNGAAFINVATGNFPIYSTADSRTDFDVLIGDTTAGRLNHTAGILSVGNGNWMFVGTAGGNGTYNASGSAGMSAGALNVGAWTGGPSIGEAVINTSGTIDLTAGNGRGGFLDASLMVGEGGGSNSGTFTLQAGTVNTAFGSVIGHNSTGTGTFNMSGGTFNNTGEFQVGRSGIGVGTQTGGVLNVSQFFVLAREGAAASGTYALSGGTVNAGTAFGFASIGSGGGSGTLSVSGTGVFNSNGGVIVGEAWNAIAATGTLNISGGGLVNTGANNLQLGTTNLGTGTVNLDGGTLQTGSITQGAGSGTVNFNGGTLKASAGTETFLDATSANVLAGGAVVDSNGFAITISKDLLADAVSTGGGLTKTGSGALTLAGDNTYTGLTRISAGSLNLSGTIVSDIEVESGASLAGSGTTEGAVTFEAGSTLSASTALSLLADGVIFSGPTNLGFSEVPQDGVEYVLIEYGDGGLSGFANLSSSYRAVIENDAAGSQLLGTVNLGNLSWNSTNGTWAIGGGGWTGDFTTFFNADSVTFGERPAASVVTLAGMLAPASVTVQNTTNPYTFTGSGSIVGATSLVKTGTGALTLATANAYTGGTTLNAGTLNVNSSSALGTGTFTIAGGTLNNTSGGPVTLTTNNPQSWQNSFTFTGTQRLDLGRGAVAVAGADPSLTVTVAANALAVGEIKSATQSFVKQGAGTLEVASLGDNVNGSVIAGPVNVAAGTLQINRTNVDFDSGDFTGAGLTGAGTVVNGANVERWFFSNPESGTFTFTGLLADGNAGRLGFHKSGAGEQVITGANTRSGRTTVAAGTLTLSQASLANNGEVYIEAAGTLNLPHGQIDEVGVLVIDGVQKLAGVYDATTDPGRISGTGSIRVGSAATGYAAWATSFGLNPAGDGAPGVDKDLDGSDNGTEFILGGSPISGSDNPKIRSIIADGSVDADEMKELLVTIAVPAGTPEFPVGTPVSSVTFQDFGIGVRGSTNLAGFPVVVTPVAPVITGLPAAPVSGGVTYEYRSFSLGGSNGPEARGFLQVIVTIP